MLCVGRASSLYRVSHPHATIINESKRI